jgi:hypothetical protein
MPDQVLPGFQLEGETFLLTFPFIEPNVQPSPETQRHDGLEVSMPRGKVGWGWMAVMRSKPERTGFPQYWPFLPSIPNPPLTRKPESSKSELSASPREFELRTFWLTARCLTPCG